MSGYAEEAVIATELRDAKHPFLPKPFTPRGLAQAVRDVLDAPS
jgi:hypothetical protein